MRFVEIKGIGLNLTDSIREHIRKKIGGLSKFLRKVDPDLVEVRIEVGKPSGHHHKGKVFYAEVNLKLPGRLLRATDEQDDLFIAVDEVKDKLQKEIKSYLGMMRDKSRKEKGEK